MSLARLESKLKRHPVLGKAKRWAWVAPGNVPDPIVLAVTAARLCGAELILKLSRRNAKVGRALVRKHASRRQKVRILTDPAGFRRRAAPADAWVVYGSDATVAAMRKHASPSAGFVAHGHRISASVVFGSALKRGPAAAVKACVRDIRPYDQQGCLSPQIIWVEGDASAFARLLQTGLEREEARCGPVRRDPETRRLRAAVLQELQVRAIDPKALTFLRDPRAAGPGPVVYQLKRGAFTTPAAGQVVAVKSFGSVADIVKGMRIFRSHLQGIGTAGTAAERRAVRQAFAGTTAVYFPRIGRLQSPPLDWNL